MKLLVFGEKSLVSSAFVEQRSTGLVEVFINLAGRHTDAAYCGSCHLFKEEVAGEPATHRAIRVTADVELQPGVPDTIDAWVVLVPELVQEHKALDRTEVLLHLERGQAHFVFLPMTGEHKSMQLAHWPPSE